MVQKHVIYLIKTTMFNPQFGPLCSSKSYVFTILYKSTLQYVPKSTSYIMSHYLIIIIITIIAAAALARKESLICIRQLSTRL
jgi:hypothetical protein